MNLFLKEGKLIVNENTSVLEVVVDSAVQPLMNNADSLDSAVVMHADNLVKEFLEIVSQRTGYPPEMLDLSLDLEADLGIDSIKRVEILSSFQKILPESKLSQLEGSLEKLAGTKTLQGIIDWIKTDVSTISTDIQQVMDQLMAKVNRLKMVSKKAPLIVD